MKEFDITVEFCDCEESRAIYTIEADNQEEAIDVAREMACEDISIVNIEDVTNYNVDNKTKKYKQYFLNIKDINNEEWILLKSKFASYLIKIAKEIYIPDVKTLEVVGTDKTIEDYKHWNVIFTRKL